MRPIVKWEAMDSYPEMNEGWKLIGNNGLPSLQDHHPAFEVEGSLGEYLLEVLFRFELELE